MNKILLILKREYLVRVRKKSFIYVTLFGPLVIAGFYGLIGYITMNQLSVDQHQVQVYDASGTLEGALKNTNEFVFVYNKEKITYQDAQKKFIAGPDDGVMVYIPPTFAPFKDPGIKIASEKNLGLSVSSKIEAKIKESVKSVRLKEAGLRQSAIDSLNNKLTFETDVINVTGESKVSGSGVKTGLGMAGAIIIYMFIFLYGTMVMRGVLEEKTNRILEVIVTSVRPFQIMMGKILGVALVGLTQLVIWAGLTTLLVFVIGGALSLNADIPSYANEAAANFDRMNTMERIMAQLGQENWGSYIFYFIFYFIGGYLIYSALFAAIASAVDAETETQQFMLPVTMPLVLSLVVAQSAIGNDPNSTLAIVLSIIPFTSPIVMMARIPFIEFGWELGLSMLFLVLGFVFTVYIAARIYRTGILLYGKKATYKELAKWIFYRY